MPKNSNPASVLIARSLERMIATTFNTEELPLRQAELAEQFGTSHIPVREAFASLAERGLVRIHANRGAVVPPLTVKQCSELSAMRCELEALAVRCAIAARGPGALTAARNALAAGAQARSMHKRAAANWAFHRALYAAADMPFLQEQLERLWQHADRYLRFAWTRAQYEHQSDSEHEGLLRACEKADAAGAEGLTRAHISQAARTVERLLTATGIS